MILFNLFDLIKNNKIYKKIMAENAFIDNLENTYKESYYKDEENNYNLKMEKIIKIKNYNLNRIINNMDIIFVKRDNKYTYICFFDFFLDEMNNRNINYGLKKIISYFISHENWSYIKKINLICSKNFNAIQKLLYDKNYDFLFSLFKHDEYINLTMKKLLKG